MKILFVDDDERVLTMFKRNLSHRFELLTSATPAQALEMVRAEPIAVVVADLRMPGMDGFELLGKISEANPLVVKIMLTGHADLDVAIAGVNEGRLFRFLTKPCTTEVLIKSLEAALEQYRLVTAEKELLRGTLHGCIKVLTEILGQVNPEAFGRSERIKRHMKQMTARLSLKDTWKYELAAMLCQIGCIFIPEEIIRKRRCLEGLTPEELQIYNMHPTVGAALLSSIPRLEEVREMIAQQDVPVSQSEHLSKGARILKICVDFDDLEACTKDKLDAVARMKRQGDVYDKHMLEVFERYILADTGVKPVDIRLVELKEGMILGEDLMSEAGELLLAKGLEVNSYSLMRLNNLAKAQKVKQPFRVLVPIGD